MDPLLTEITGKANTVTEETAGTVEIQPAVLVPEIEYCVVEDGETVAEPPVMVQELAPPRVITKLLPLQIVPLFAVMTGNAKTVMVETAVLPPIQPTALVPVMLQLVVEEGDTANEPPVMVQVEAPPGTILNVCPLQIVPLEAVTTGSATTVMLATAGAVEIQPAVLVPVTEYAVVAAGETIAEPLLQVQVLAPLGDMVKDCPLQIEPLFTEITGMAYTVTLAIAGAADTHPAVLVPVTEYCVVEEGETVAEPPEYVYVKAHDGLKKTDWPL